VSEVCPKNWFESELRMGWDETKKSSHGTSWLVSSHPMGWHGTIILVKRFCNLELPFIPFLFDHLSLPLSTLFTVILCEVIVYEQ
jgi:hypothetical protein